MGLISLDNGSVTALSMQKLAKQAKLDAVARAAQDGHATAGQITRDEVWTKCLAELVDTNKLLRDQNRMIWDLLQAQRPKSSPTASM